MINYRSAKVTATGNVGTGPARLIAIHAVCGGTAGSIVLKDGSGGATKLDLDTPASGHGGQGESCHLRVVAPGIA